MKESRILLQTGNRMTPRDGRTGRYTAHDGSS